MYRNYATIVSKVVDEFDSISENFLLLNESFPEKPNILSPAEDVVQYGTSLDQTGNVVLGDGNYIDRLHHIAEGEEEHAVPDGWSNLDEGGQLWVPHSQNSIFSQFAGNLNDPAIFELK